MEFIVIYETNHKENEMFIHYCQWTGNEKEMMKLLKYIELADYEELDGGDYSSVWAATNKRIPESAVDAHVGLDDPNGYDKLFNKHAGSFRCPDFGDEDCSEDEKPYKIARYLDEMFYGGRGYFSKLFKKEKPVKPSASGLPEGVGICGFSCDGSCMSCDLHAKYGNK